WGIGAAGPVVSDRPVAGYEPSSSPGAKPSSSALSGLLITAPSRTSSIVAICVITPALQGVHAVPARRRQTKRSLGGTRRPRQICLPTGEGSCRNILHRRQTLEHAGQGSLGLQASPVP